MNKIKMSPCVFCKGSINKRYLLSGVWSCKECINIAHHIMFNDKVEPKNIREQAVISLIFYLELDLVQTRNWLNESSSLNSLKSIIQDKLLTLERIDIDYNDVSNDIRIKMESIISEHKLMLSLFL